MNLRLYEMTYCVYFIGPNQQSLTVQRYLHFRVVQVHVLLVFEVLYSLHRFSFLEGLQLNCYHHIDYSLHHSGIVVVVGNLHLYSYG